MTCWAYGLRLPFAFAFCSGNRAGGEWGGAALLATEYAPPDKRGWFGMFPQLGPSIGFLLAALSFLGLSIGLTEAEFKAWGWRIPFLTSALLVAVGLFIRYKLAETPAFAAAMAQHRLQKTPLKTLMQHHLRPVLLGALAMVICYNLFYTATVFCLSYGTNTQGIPRADFLKMLCIAVIFMALATPISAALSDRLGRVPVLIAGNLAALALGFAMPEMLANNSVIQITLFLALTLFLMGVTFAPMGAYLPEQFPVEVRYTGAGVAYSLGGILGASLAPYLSQLLVNTGGLPYVGAYMSAMAAISLIAVILLGEVRGGSESRVAGFFG